jgi:predicted transposase/invertase (TIGR01784 family)
VSRPLLDPKLDLVFKLLLQDDVELVQSMIEAVLTLPGPITSLEILNPEPLRHTVHDKGVILDVRVDVKGLGRVDIEMQGANAAGTANRFLYYWAREYAQLIKRGNEYLDLTPVYSILWLDCILRQGTPFHSVYRLLEQSTQMLYSNHIEIHTLEFPKIAQIGNDPKLVRWTHFLSGTDADRETLANEDRIMEKAMTRLTQLSEDDILRAQAADRERDRFGQQILLSASRDEGRQEGRQEGRREGRQEGRQEALAEATIGQYEFKFGQASESVRAKVMAASPEELKAMLLRILTAANADDVV